MSAERDDGFLSRWSRRKARARDAVPSPLPDEPPRTQAARNEAARTEATRPQATRSEAAHTSAVPPVNDETARPAPSAPAGEPPPTLEDVAALTREADFSRFVAPGVDEGVKQAALRKLFSDPRFNVMDGLDTYIDDYNKADPLPASMLRKMAQSAFLGLIREDDENPDLQLQPDDADRRPRAEPGDAAEPGRSDGRDAA